MPFVFEQPNLDNGPGHLYFDPGDSRLVTVFTNEARADPSRVSREPGNVQHLAFALSQATFHQAVERLDERGVRFLRRQGPRLHGLDHFVLLGAHRARVYRFEPPFGCTHSDVLLEAHHLRVSRGDYNIDREHVADAIDAQCRSRSSLSDDRTSKNPYRT